MSLAQKLLKIDAFTKTKDDVRIRTRSGGLITIMLLLTSLILIINEWKMFNTIQIIPSLVVDRDRNKRMNMFLDIDFLNMPCDYLYLDMMDESGEIQLDITGTENCQKTQLSDGSCNVKGNVYLNRLQGHFHFAPGKPYQNPVTGQHSHDIQEYGNKNFDHKINKISFHYDEDLTSNNDNKLIQSFFEESINQVIAEPLTDTAVLDGDSYKQYSYFLKIVPTRFEDLTKRPHPNRHKNELLLDGTSFDSKTKKVEKIQYTATTHSKPINGGRDEDHPNTLHQRGGIPGVFFVFDISSLKIINKLQYRMNWYGFILNLLSSLGGIFALYTVLDKVTYKTMNYYRSKKDQ